MDKDSFIVGCRNLYRNDYKPFYTDLLNDETYNELTNYAHYFTIKEFIGYFAEGQYYINLWTAIILLDSFNPDENLKFLNNTLVIDECYDTIHRYKGGFNEIQLNNYKVWLEHLKDRYALPGFL